MNNLNMMKKTGVIALYIAFIIIGLFLMLSSLGCFSVAKSKSTQTVNQKTGETVTQNESFSRAVFWPDGPTTASTTVSNATASASGAQDAAGIGEVANEGKNQRLLIILGAVGLAVGVFVTFHYRANTKFGVAVIVASGCLTGAGIVYKEIQHYFSIAAGVAIVAAVVYLVWRLSRK